MSSRDWQRLAETGRVNKMYIARPADQTRGENEVVRLRWRGQIKPGPFIETRTRTLRHYIVPSKELIKTSSVIKYKPDHMAGISDFIMLFLNIGNNSSEHLNHWDSWRADLDLVSKLEYKGGMTKIEGS